MRREKICGIYKITSPSGKIYIGESKDILTRWVYYRNLSCKGQGKLLNSLKKYTPESHIFEIIERCEFDELKCRERHWQDFYDVLNEGLNLKLTECNEFKAVYSEEAKEKNRQAKLGKYTGWESPVAEPVINTQTEEIYPSAKEAFKKSSMESYDYFKSKLNGNSTNDTYFMYYKNYEKYGAIKPKEIKIIKQEVRDTLTLKKYNTINEASKDLGIKSNNLRRYLSGERPNTTYCVYEKDYVEGVIHYPVEARPVTKVIDDLTGIVYNSVKEVSEKTGIKLNTLKAYLSGRSTNAERNTFRYYKEEESLL